MAANPAIGGAVPTSSRPDIEAAMAAAQQEQGAPDDQAAEGEQMSEVQARIVRLEDALVNRGVLHESDLAPVQDPNAPPDPNDPNAAAGAPPAAPAPGAPVQ